MEGRLDSLDMVHSDWLGMMHLDLPNVVGLEWCCQLKLAEVASALWYFLSCRIRVDLAPLPTPLLRANLKLVCHVFGNLGMGQTVKTRGIKFLRWKHKTFPNQSQLKKIYFWSLKWPMSTFSPRKEEFLNESSKKSDECRYWLREEKTEKWIGEQNEQSSLQSKQTYQPMDWHIRWINWEKYLDQWGDGWKGRSRRKKGWLRRETMAVLKCYRIKAMCTS